MRYFVIVKWCIREKKMENHTCIVGIAKKMLKIQILMSMIVSMKSIWDGLTMIHLSICNGTYFKLHLFNLYIREVLYDRDIFT